VSSTVHRALTTPLALPSGASASLAQVAPDRLLREMRFLTEYPGGPDFLGGSIDALFEHEGRIFILDWKSNALPDYGPESLEACVREHYDLQVRIYTLATLRFLGIQDRAAFETRFGGCLYVFLRGLPQQGVWSSCPDWAEVVRWASKLAELQPGAK
jgi:exodeoxyribonuclease V beta subunit